MRLLLKTHIRTYTKQDGTVVPAHEDKRASAKQQMPAEKIKQPAPLSENQAFKEWFGDSKVVDAYGKPLVVYHGTPSGGFVEFGENTSSDIHGIYFTVSPSYANEYSVGDFKQDKNKAASQVQEKKGPSTYPVYLSIQNMLDFTIPASDESVRAFTLKVGQLDDLSRDLVREAIAKGKPTEEIFDIAREYYESIAERDPIAFAAKKNGVSPQGYIAGRRDGTIPAMDDKEREEMTEEMERAAFAQSSKKATELIRSSGYDGIFRPDSLEAKNENGTFNPFIKKRLKGGQTDTYIVFLPSQIKSALGNRGTFDPYDPDITKSIAPKVPPVKRKRFVLRY